MSNVPPLPSINVEDRRRNSNKVVEGLKKTSDNLKEAEAFLKANLSKADVKK